jgi:hypothetical protein
MSASPFSLKPGDQIIHDKYGQGTFIGFIGDGLECQIGVRRPLSEYSDEQLMRMFARLKSMSGKELDEAINNVRSNSIQSNPIVMTSTVQPVRQ